MKLGVAGIGKMGAAIAARLIEVGHDVTVWNRTPQKARAVEGAKIAANPAELAENSEAIITILTDAAALNAVYNGPSGLLHGKVAGKLFIDMSTVLPATEIALAGAHRAQAHHLAVELAALHGEKQRRRARIAAHDVHVEA